MHLIDFHAHVLPGLDDGAANFLESRQLLLSLQAQGVETVVATPHRYRGDSIDDFISRRDAALEQIRENIQEAIPNIIPGAEVALYAGLSQETDLKRLCLGDTDYILIEMPFFYWNQWDYQELYNIITQHKLKPIIAHLDRYATRSVDVKKFAKLLDYDVLVQINADSLMHFSSLQIVKRLWRLGAVTVLGSDCHRPDFRPCHLETACEIFKKKFGLKAFDRIMGNGEKILQNHSVKISK